MRLLVLSCLCACSEYDFKPRTEPPETEETATVETDSTESPVEELDLPLAVCSASPNPVSPPFETAVFSGAGSMDPEGQDLTYDWSFVSTPTGSVVTMPGGTGSNRTVTPDVAGDYTAQLTVVAEDGRESVPCLTTLEAIPAQNLWVEMFWQYSGDDMDLHLLAPFGFPRTYTDCYYANCAGFELEWGAFGSEDNPILDLDDISGVGPENINIPMPQNGEFLVFVHDYPGSVYNGANPVTVNVYVDGVLEWTATKTLSGEDADVYFAEISWPSGVVTSF